MQSCKSAVFRIKQKSGHVKGLLEIKFWSKTNGAASLGDIIEEIFQNIKGK